MNLAVIWFVFIVLMSFSELDQPHFLLFLGSMFYFTYLYNQVKPTEIPPQLVILLLMVPGNIFWYIFIVYNDFLSFNPIQYELLFSIYLIYVYLSVFFFWEFHKSSKT